MFTIMVPQSFLFAGIGPRIKEGGWEVIKEMVVLVGGRVFCSEKNL